MPEASVMADSSMYPTPPDNLMAGRRARFASSTSKNAAL